MFTTSNQQLPCDVLYSRLSSNRSRQLVGYGGRDSSVYIFPFAGFAPMARLEGLSAPVTSLAFSPDQTFVVAGSDTGGLRLWDVSTEKNVRTFLKGHSATVTDVDMHSSGHFVGTVSTDNNLRIWDTRKSSCLQSYKDAKAPLCAVQFSPNGQLVATGCARGIVRIYNLRTGSLEAKLESHTGAITSLSFHPELYYLAVGSGDATISVWNVETFHREFRSRSINTPIDNVQFCGNRLLAASDQQLQVYDPQRLSDETAVALKAPWTMIGDLAYISFSDEAWFVECNGSTSMTGRMRLNEPPSSPSSSTAAAGFTGGGRANPTSGNHSSSNSNSKPQQAARPQPPPPTALDRVGSAPTSNLTSPGVTSPSGSFLNGTGKTTPVAKRQPTPPQPHAGSTQAAARDSPLTTRIQPTLPRSQRMAVQENYVIEKPRITNETPYNPAGHGAFPAVAKAFSAPPPEVPQVPLVDEGGEELEVVGQLLSTSESFVRLLTRRCTNLRGMRFAWSQDQRIAVEHLRQTCEDGTEAGAVYDFLTAMQQQRMKEKMVMEALPDLLDIIQCSLNSSYDPLLLVALRTLRSMNTKFRARVEEAQRRSRMAQSNGYNDPFGMNSAGACAERFATCAVQVMALSGRRDSIGDEARHVLSELPPLPR